MQITMSAEYAIRAMIYLAENGRENIVHIPEISAYWNIPENYLRKIIPLLRTAGLIISQRGTGGGIALALAPDSITPLQIIEAVEGKIFLNKCLINGYNCMFNEQCSVHDLWQEAQQALRTILSKKSILDLARERAQKITELAEKE